MEEKVNKRIKLSTIIFLFTLLIFFLIYILSYRIGKIMVLRTINVTPDNDEMKISENEFKPATIIKLTNINENNNNNNNQNSTDNDNSNNNNDDDDDNKPPTPPVPPVPEVEEVKATEKSLNWNALQELDVFSTTYYGNQNIIAPRLKGTYDFAIENTTKVDVTADITFVEGNIYNINMKYKIKVNGVYVGLNQWQKIEDIVVNNLVILSKNRVPITLEWYWEESANDTAIGQMQGVPYNLNIKIEAEQI